MDELVTRSAREVVAALAGGEVSPLEVVEAAAAHIAAVDDRVNALPIRCFDRAREAAGRLRPPAADRAGHHLHGLPVVIKDLTDVAGVPSTRGSQLYAGRRPERSDRVVETLEGNGAVVIAKSNTPELGAGSHTFNSVFGLTRNPWDLTRSAGGSSGGSAAALATGQAWLATGTDFGGSLRNPASFCGVVGLRPTPGTIAGGPKALPFSTLSVDGPMARNVGDVALMLDAMAGHHPVDPLSAPPAARFVDAAERPAIPRRVALSVDLGIAPVDPLVAAVCRRTAEWFAAQGAEVDETCFDLSEAADTFHVLRALAYATADGGLLDHRDVVKEEIIWNIEAGMALSIDDIVRAERARAAIFLRAAEFFSTYDVLLCPAAVIPPFPSEWRWPTAVGRTTFDNYLGWLIVCSAISLTSCPTMSLPAGLTPDGLPVGVQVVAAHRAEARLLSVAAAFEADHAYATMVPRLPAAPRA